MPLQNRVTPIGDIVATPHRGLFTGNRGIIHDPGDQDAARRSAGRARPGSPASASSGAAAQGDGRAQLDRSCSFSTRPPHSRPGTGHVSTAAATTPTGFVPAWEEGNGVARHSCARDRCRTAWRAAVAGKASGCTRCRCRWRQLPDGAMVQARRGEYSLIVRRPAVALDALPATRRRAPHRGRQAATPPVDLA